MKNILLLTLFIISVFAVSAKDFIITYECIDSTRKLSASVWIGEGNAKYYWETIPEELSGSGVISDQNWSYTFNDIPTGKKIRLKIESKNLYMFRIVWFMQFSSFDIEQWGSAEWRSTSSMFRSNINLNISATDTPNFSNNQSMNSMFMNCTKLESINNIHTWNTNRVKDMAMLFMNCNNFNQSINSWKTDSVKTFEMMFQNAKKFNQNLDSWNTSQVTNFEKMFENAHIFNGRIGTWNPKKAITFEKMFNHAYAFNQPIGNWNTENAVTFEEMFSHAHVFNQPIGDWNTKNLTNVRRMFWEAHNFNQPIGEWNTEKIINMEWMFKRAYKFNQPVGKWNTSNVINMWDMFIFNYDFNQDISNWNVENVVNMRGMLFDANSFDQNLGKWKFHPLANTERMISNTNISCFNYTATLNGWAQNNPHIKDKTFEVYHVEYGNNAVESRNQLINQGWQFTGDVGLETDCGITSSNSVFAPTIKIYPIPTNESIIIEGLVHDTKIAVVNILGENVSTIQAHSGTNIISLLQHINGVYLIRFEQNGQMITRKVVLQK